MNSAPKSADLHLHTMFSDGTYTPQELIAKSLKAGLSAISVVDHDTVSGLDESIKAGNSFGIEVIPGIELTAEYNNTEIHLLGYLLDYKNKPLLEELGFLRKNRIERIYKICQKLQALGIDLNPQSVFDIAQDGSPGRLHIARAMVKEGVVGSIYEAFKKHIGDKCPGYVAGFKLSPQEAIQLIKKVGGIPVLAHPYVLNNDELISKFTEFGLMGLEVYYPEHSQGMINFYLNLAKKLNLLVTGGSDCHGAAKPEVKLGSVKIPYELVEKLKEAKSKL